MCTVIKITTFDIWRVPALSNLSFTLILRQPVWKNTLPVTSYLHSHLLTCCLTVQSVQCTCLFDCTACEQNLIIIYFWPNGDNNKNNNINNEDDTAGAITNTINTTATAAQLHLPPSPETRHVNKQVNEIILSCFRIK